MSTPKYTYRSLIDFYFREFGEHTSGFSTGDCRLFVKKFKRNFDDAKFLRALALKLVDLDTELPDYSSDEDEP